MSFKNLQLTEPILKALDAQGYTQPTPIQKQAIPLVLKGRDLLGVAQTGTGKTAALEYSPENIRVNAVGPAFIDTPLLDQLNEDIKKRLMAKHPIGRVGRSEEGAEMIQWLARGKGTIAPGGNYSINGGSLVR